MTIPYSEAKFGLSESSDVNHPLVCTTIPYSMEILGVWTLAHV